MLHWLAAGCGKRRQCECARALTLSFDPLVNVVGGGGCGRVYGGERDGCKVAGMGEGGRRVRRAGRHVASVLPGGDCALANQT